ncbi:MAG: ribosome biogenesis GTPase Der [Chloroflexi bacterium]|nr:ribosome biogenesis GTPase Der [Chloroflexota bacterium]
MAELPMVALVGRPNVGKSTLFNRIVGERVAVTHDLAGTTRDRQHAEAEWQGLAFTLVDTGGIEPAHRVTRGAEEPLAEDSRDFIREIREQAEAAIAEADVIVFVVDVTTGITAADDEVARLLRRSNRPVIVAANKSDNQKLRENMYEFYNLGMGDVFAVSSIHGYGTGDMLDAVVDALPDRVPDTDEDDLSVKITILGRPNVGKSSLLNRLLGEERVIVSPVAGTTRDSIDTQIIYHGEPVTLIDTAGIRRRGKIEPGVEKWSVLRSLRAIKRADVCLLLIDAADGPTTQDAHIAGFILDELKSVIVVVNKWDLVPDKTALTIVEYEAAVRDALHFLPYVPVTFVSALTGQRVSKLMPLVMQIYQERFARIPTAELNKLIRDALLRQAPPSRQGRRLKIRYTSQVAVDPPKFLFHINDRRLLHFSYQRYIENTIRAHYPFTGTPIHLSWRESRREPKR